MALIAARRACSLSHGQFTREKIFFRGLRAIRGVTDGDQGGDPPTGGVEFGRERGEVFVVRHVAPDEEVSPSPSMITTSRPSTTL